MAAGVFIVLEGPDGAGKSTQARRLCEELRRRRGVEPLLVREPGGTAIGERVRDVLLDPANEAMDPRTELFLYMASRAQLCREAIAPALAAGRVVVSDRFLASSAVYQGFAAGLGLEAVLEIGAVAVGSVRPDLTIVLDMDERRALDRLATAGRPRDRMEQKDAAFHRRVREGYRRFAEVAPARGATARAVVVDADRPEAEVHAAVFALVANHLDDAGAGPGPGAGGGGPQQDPAGSRA